jgi:hypothetical protein
MWGIIYKCSYIINMHFNNKYIGIGDSEKDIRDKVNYNFNQILSFAVGPDGLIGPKGATGIPGPSGKLGKTGPTGERASEWFRSTSSPATGDKEFDLWVDDSSSLGDVYERGISSWSYTGFSLFSSNFFEVYPGIIGPLGITSKSAIGFNSTYTPDQTSLVLSDSYFSSLDVNPNNSKVLVATEDQIDNPIFSFGKSNGNSSYSPSFYWKNTGLLSDLIFKSPGKLSIGSLLDIDISSYEPSGGGNILFNGDSFYSITSGNFNYISPFRIYFVASNNNIILSSLNIGINTLKFYTKTLTEISHNGGDYILKSVPTPGSSYNYFGGISVNSSATDVTNRVFNFTGILGKSVLHGLPLGTVISGNHKQTVFGETGGVSPGSTGGPYSYHVKRISEVYQNQLVRSKFIKYNSRNNTTISFLSDFGPFSYFFDLSNVSNWNSNLIVATSPDVRAGVTDPHIIIPSSVSTSLEPVFYSEEGNEYRVYFNDKGFLGKKIAGIVYVYYYKDISSGSIIPRTVGITFSSQCSYVDLFYAYVGSSTNPNGRIFWKTCTGEGGVLEMTNNSSIGVTTAPIWPTR